MRRKLVLLVAGLAAQKYGKALDKEQEILVNIADIVSNLYAMESALFVQKKQLKQLVLKRINKKCYTLKYSAKNHSTKSKQMRKKHLLQLKIGDMLRLTLSSLRKLTRHTPLNVIPKKREIAAKILEDERYTV